MTASGARRTDASGADERPEPSARPARAGLRNLFRFLSAAWLPRLGVRGGLAAALVLLALAALAPAGPAHAQQSALPAVTGVTVVPASATSLKVTWNAVANAQTYNVLWKGSGEAYHSSRIASGITALTYTITGLTTGTSYHGVREGGGDWLQQ